MKELLDLMKISKRKMLILTIVFIVCIIVMGFIYPGEFKLIHEYLSNNTKHFLGKSEWIVLDNLIKPIFKILLRITLLMEIIKLFVISDVLDYIRGILIDSIIFWGCIIALGDVFKSWVLCGEIHLWFNCKEYMNGLGFAFIIIMMLYIVGMIIYENSKYEDTTNFHR